MSDGAESDSLAQRLQRALNVKGLQEGARDIQAPGGLQRLGARTATVPGRGPIPEVPPSEQLPALFQAPAGGSIRALQQGAREMQQAAGVARPQGPRLGVPASDMPLRVAPRTAEEFARLEEAARPEAAPTARDLQGSNPLGDRLTALLRAWKPTNPEHGRMATSLLGGDPEALRGFQAALAASPEESAKILAVPRGMGGGPAQQALPATNAIREIRGTREGMSEATTVPQGGPGGGNWINPGYPGWDAKNILPVGGGQFRDFNFGGYGDPVRQQQAEQFKQMEMLKWMGPEAAAHHLAAQMASKSKGRELDIEEQKAKSEAEFRKVHGEALTTEARAKAGKMSPEEIARERLDWSVKTDPSLIEKHPGLKRIYRPGTLTPKEELQATLGLRAEEEPTLMQAAKHPMTVKDIMESPLREDFLREKGNLLQPRGWGSTLRELIDPRMRKQHAISEEKAKGMRGKGDEEIWAEIQKKARE